MTPHGEAKGSVLFIILPRLSQIAFHQCRSRLSCLFPSTSLLNHVQPPKAFRRYRFFCAVSDPDAQCSQSLRFPPRSLSNEELTPLKQDAGTPTAVDYLRELFHERRNGTEANRDSIRWEVEATKAVFPYKLDDFQVRALEALVERKSVVLTAPTGSGKTVTAECAIYLALVNGMRVFYTTPLKALSNQKYFDFRRQFGERVGLLTGDTTLNRDGDIIVMTTEVYRNMLYEEKMGETSELESVFAVVLDEFHYMNSPDRGTVWEESVINSPEHVLLVALSATMGNAEDVCRWFRTVHGPTILVRSLYRPVPLRFYFADRMRLWPLFSSTSESKRKQFKKRKRGSREDVALKINPRLLTSIEESQKPRDQRSRRSPRGRYQDIPSYPYVVRRLRRKDMLPAIFFVFSREGCDRAANAAAAEREDLITDDEARQLEARLERYTAENPEIVDSRRISLARQGIASHHAGLLPLWKAFVEELFREGLLKVIFATETLAAGIDMPCRTTVISSVSKRTDEGNTRLSTSDVLQMAGRAGRRGKDLVGHSVIMKSPRTEARDAFTIVTDNVDKISSKFAPTYGMVLNLLQTRTVEDARKLIKRSFGNFLRERNMSGRLSSSVRESNGPPENNSDLVKENILLSVLDDARSIVAGIDPLILLSHSKRLARLKAEQRALHYLCIQREEQWREVIDDLVAFSPPGTVLVVWRKPRNVEDDKKGKRLNRKRFSEALNKAAVSGDRSALTSMYLEAENDDLNHADVLMRNDEELKESCEAVALLGTPSLSHSEGLEFLGVGQDGAIHLFSSEYIVKVMDAKIEVNDSWKDANFPPKQEWEAISHGYHRYVMDGPWTAAGAYLKTFMQGIDKYQNFSKRYDDSDVPEIRAQRMRVDAVLSEIRSSELAKDPKYSSIAKAMKAVEKLEQHPRLKKALRGRSDYGKSRASKNKALGIEEPNVAEGDSLELFLSILAVLQEYGYIDKENKLTELGKMGAKVRSNNELWTSLVLMEDALGVAQPQHFAAVLGATLEATGRPDTYVGFEPSAEVHEICGNLSQMKQILEARQLSRGIDLDVFLDSSEVGIVEAWAQGISWVDLISGTSLQEGDIVRRLRRIMDLLRQVPHLPFVSLALKLNAKRALTLMDRFPVSDDLTYSVRDNERFVDYESDIEDDAEYLSKEEEEGDDDDTSVSGVENERNERNDLNGER